MLKARDEAGNIWETDLHGRPLRLLQAVGQSAPEFSRPPDTWQQASPRSAAGPDGPDRFPGEATARAVNRKFATLADKAAATAHPHAANPASTSAAGPTEQAERAFAATVLGLDPGARIPPEDLLMQGSGSLDDLQPRPFAGQRTGAQMPEMRGGLPVGTQIEWDLDQPERPFDRAEYVWKTYGYRPNEEATVAAIWNANTGNPNLTAEDILEAYKNMGLAPPLPDDLARAIDDARKGLSFRGFDTSQAEQDYFRKLDEMLEMRGHKPETVPGTIGAKAAQTFLWGNLDEAHGIGGALRAWREGDSLADGYRLERDLIRREQERAEQAHPWISLGTEIPVGLLSGGGGFRNAVRAGELARMSRQLGNVRRAERLERQAVRSAAGAGARTGAVAGFGYGEGPLDSAFNAGIGGATGGLFGYGGQKLGHHLASAPKAGDHPPPLTPDGRREVIALGVEHDVPVYTSDVFSPSTKFGEIVRTWSEQAPYGSLVNRIAQQERRGGAIEIVGRELGGEISPDLLADVAHDWNKNQGLIRRFFGNARTSPEDAARLLFSQDPAKVQQLVTRLSPAGRTKAQGAIIFHAFEKAGGIGKLNPDAFATEVTRLGESIGVVFAERDLARLHGLERLLQYTRRAGVATALPPDLQRQLKNFDAVAESVFRSQKTRVATMAGLLGRAYESPKVRDLLVGLSRAPHGSRAEGRLIERITMLLASQTQVRAHEHVTSSAPPPFGR